MFSNSLVVGSTAAGFAKYSRGSIIGFSRKNVPLTPNKSVVRTDVFQQLEENFPTLPETRMNTMESKLSNERSTRLFHYCVPN